MVQAPAAAPSHSASSADPTPLYSNTMQALLDALAGAHLSSEVQRVFHGRGGAYPGLEPWVLDHYAPVWVSTSFRPALDAELAALHAALLARDPALHWVHQTRHEGRSDTRLMAGTVPEAHVVTEAGCRFRVHVQRGQNHGLFLDMAEGRRWVRQQAAAQPGLKVLNLFAYTCAFSVVALRAGAAQVVNLDMSAGALAQGRDNHRLNGVEAGASFLAHDLFSSWAKVQRGGPYGLVIVDPPSHQKGSFVATKDYARVLRRLPALLAPGGHALLCLNAPELGPGFLHEGMAAEAPGLVFVQRLPNPTAFVDAWPDRALKVLVYRAPG